MRGRAPYGYLAVERVVAGRRERTLAPDERTAAVVRRIFGEYAEGSGLQLIAERLTADGIPNPGAEGGRGADGAAAWSKSAVRAILVNTRYSGRCSAGSPLGHRPIVPAEIFDRVESRFATRRSAPARSHEHAQRPYALRGLVRCGRCQRLMQGTWNNGEPYYRCRFPAEYASASQIDHPRNVYLREQTVLEPLHSWVLKNCSPSRLLSLDGSVVRHERVLRSTAVKLRQLREAGGDCRAEVLRSFGLGLTFADHDRTLHIKAELGPGIPVVRGSVVL
ncbi:MULTISPECIES: recombinase family protein [unclassified Kitasatospora]|uniref:recombinase family protein n=1 Tax=unclassified Kitasatospora TaxID=2633591 RepID=UPI001AE02389|nr:recombinase family protein [Kitasatospora sp. RG8]MBP0455076.1 recombinase family protein [Kitasatospora sp. RG8]